MRGLRPTERMLDTDRIPAWAPVLAGLLVFAVHDWTLQPWTLDDAYISFRYADNLVAGHGVVFNAGERVEGYTNFLWLLLMAGGRALGFSPVVFSKLLGGVLDVLSLTLVGFAHRIVPGVSRRTAMFGALLLGTCGVFSKWSMSGMEVPLVGLLSTAAVLVHLRGRQRQDGAGLAVASGVLAGLAAMSRPDAGLVFGVLFLDRVARLLRGRGRTASLGAMVTAFGLVAGGWFLWRLSYYDQLLPNTFYVKVGATGDQLVRGLVYLWQCVNVAWPLIVVPLAAPFVAVEGGLSVVALLLLLHTLYVVAVGGDVFWGYRFYAAYLPLGALAASSVIGHAPLRPGFRAAFAGLAVAINLWWMATSAQLNTDAEVSQDGIEVGRWLAEHAPADALLATNIAGSIPYASGLRTIDTLGLNDLHIAHRHVDTMGQGRPGHEKGDGAYVLSRAPDYVIFASSRGSMLPKFLGDQELYDDPAFHDQYDLHSYLIREGLRLLVWVRRADAGGKGLTATPITVQVRPPRSLDPAGSALPPAGALPTPGTTEPSPTD